MYTFGPLQLVAIGKKMAGHWSPELRKELVSQRSQPVTGAVAVEI